MQTLKNLIDLQNENSRWKKIIKKSVSPLQNSTKLYICTTNIVDIDLHCTNKIKFYSLPVLLCLILFRYECMQDTMYWEISFSAWWPRIEIWMRLHSIYINVTYFHHSFLFIIVCFCCVFCFLSFTRTHTAQRSVL